MAHPQKAIPGAIDACQPGERTSCWKRIVVGTLSRSLYSTFPSSSSCRQVLELRRVGWDSSIRPGGAHRTHRFAV